MANNTLLFEVGIERANDQYNKILEEVRELAKYGAKGINIKIQLDKTDELKQTVDLLAKLGNGDTIRPLQTAIQQLRQQLVDLGKGSYTNTELTTMKTQAEQAGAEVARLQEKLSRLDKSIKTAGGANNVAQELLVNRSNLQDKVKDASDRYNMLREAYEKAAAAAKNAGDVGATSGNKMAESAMLAEKAMQQLQTIMAPLRETVTTLSSGVNELAGVFKKISSGQVINQGGLFDPQRFVTLQEAIDRIIGEVNRLRTAFEGFGNLPGLTTLTTTINGLQINAKGVSDMLTTLNGALKFTGSTEEIKNYEARVVALKDEITQLENKLKTLGEAAQKANQEMRSVSETKGNEATLNNNLDLLNQRIYEVTRAYGELIRRQGELAASGKTDDGLEHRIQLMQQYLEHLKTLYNLDLSKVGIFKSKDALWGEENAIPFGKVTGRQVMNDVKQVNAELDKTEKAAKNAAKSQSKALEEQARSAKVAGKAISDLQKKYEKFKNNTTYLKADKLGIDTTQYALAIERLLRYQRILRYISENGGHDASRITGSVGYHNMLNNLDIQLGRMKQQVAEREKAIASTKQLVEAEHRLGEALVQSTNQMRGQSQVLSDLKNMALQYLSVWGAQSFINNIIEQGGQLEQQRLSIQAILGDAAHAQTLFNQVKDLAIKSPFGVTQIDQMTKQLSAYGFQYSELFDLTKRMADISAATGTEVSRLALALGHVKSEAALSGYTLRQFSMANVPLLTKLTEKLGVSAKEVRDMVRKKEIGYEQVLEIMKELTDEGGMFYNAQETMSEALNAKFKNLRDSFQIMYSEMAESGVGDFLKSIAGFLTDLSRNWKILMPMLISGGAAFGMLKLSTYALNQGFAATGKLLLGNAIASSKYSMAQLRVMAAQRRVLGTTSRLNIALTGLATTLKRIGSFVFSPVTLGFAAVEGLIYLWQRHNQELEKAKELSDGFKQEGSEGIKNLTEQINVIEPSKGKNDSELRQGIDSMTETLKDYGVNVKQIFDDTFGADASGKVKSLAEQYDYLKGKLEDTLDVYKELKKTADAFEYGINHTNGGWFDDDVNTDLTQYADAVKNFQDTLTDFYGKYESDVDAAVEKAVKSDKAFAEATKNMKTNAEKFREYVSNSDSYPSTFDVMNSVLSGTYSTDRSNINESFMKMTKAKKEAMKELDDFLDGTENKLKDKGYDFQDLAPKQIDNLLKQSREWIDKHPEWANIMDDIKSKLEVRWPIKLDPESTDINKPLEDWQKQMQDWIDEHNLKEVIQITADMSRESIKKLIHEKMKDAQEVVDNTKPILLRFGVDLENIPSADNLPAGLKTPWGKHQAADYKTESDKYQSLMDFLKEFALPEPKDKNKGKGRTEDKNAKAVRERVRVIKEAADAFEYWRNKVGDKAAWTHVQEEFGSVLDTIHVTANNIGDLKGNLKNVLNSKAFAAIRDKKVKTQIEKEVAKDTAQIDRKDFEKSSAEAASVLKERLESLTRAWEIYNKVRDTTGNESLAKQMSQLSVDRSSTTTVADAIKQTMQEIANIDFDKVFNLDEKGIREYVYTLGLADDDIDGVTEGLKKWKDLQKQVVENDIESFSALVGSLQDYDSLVSRINRNLEKTIAANERLVSEGIITRGQADAANQTARVQADDEKWKLSSQYINLMNDSLALTKKEVGNGLANAEEILNRKLENGVISAREFVEEIAKLRDIMSGFENNSIFGKNNILTSYIRGGEQGMRTFLKGRITAADRVIYDPKSSVEEVGKALSKRGKSQDLLKELDSGFLATMNDVNVAFGALSNALTPVIKLFDELGMKGVGEVVGGIQGALSGATTGALGSVALFGAAAGPYGAAIGAGLSIASSVIPKLFDNGSAEYEKAKAEYENLISVWDSLIDKKMEYLNESWGTEAKNAGTEALALLKTEVEATKVLAEQRLAAGASMGSHSMRHRMWAGSYGYEGKNWKDVAGRISNALGGVTFNNMEDMLNMTADQLMWIKENYVGLWANMDGDFREYLEKLIQYGDQAKDIISTMQEKLTGWDLKSIESDWASLMSKMDNDSDDLAESLEEKLRNAIMNSMIENLFSDKLQKLIDSAKMNDTYLSTSGVAKKHTYDSNGNILDDDVLSEFTSEEYAESMEKAKVLGIEATRYRDMLKAIYGMKDSGSTSSKVIQGGFNENETGLLLSYVNEIRADVSIDRDAILQYFPQFIQMLTAGGQSLRNIESHTAAIMGSNAAIQQSVDDLRNDFRGLKNNTWKMPVS